MRTSVKQLKKEILLKHSDKILNGNKLSELISSQLLCEVEKIQSMNSFIKKPSLLVFQIGNRPDSNLYVENKLKLCHKLNFQSSIIRFPDNITKQEIIENIEKANNDININGIILQLPFPEHLKNHKLDILSKVSVYKDIDGLNPWNSGLIMSTKHEDDSKKINFMSNAVIQEQEFCLAPPTSLGVVELIRLGLGFNNELLSYKENYLEKLNEIIGYYDEDFCLSGKNAVVLGRSIVAGRPISTQLGLLNATVTVCHSKTGNIEKYIKDAEIIVSAVGKENLITKNMINDKCTIIDVGINVSKDFNDTKLVMGDVDFCEVTPKCKFISPVPNGVGRMTVVMLLNNLVKAWKYQIIKNKLL